MDEGSCKPADPEAVDVDVESKPKSSKPEKEDTSDYDKPDYDTPDYDTAKSKPIAGMGKEELLLHSNTPFFNGLRSALLYLCMACWLGLMVAVIYLIATHRPCTPPPDRVWWKESLIYQIYPRSFYDSDGDGIGDLAGIQEKLPHLVELGVGAVWISPFYTSPMKDFGYDVADFRGVDPTFGTMDDFDALLEAMHDNNIRLIMDFIPNHSSDQHEWFNKSVANDPAYRNYYRWEPCHSDSNGNTVYPNNWVSVFSGPMWSDPINGWCYLHQFFLEQPDLNFRNNRVKDEMDNVLRFWLDKGVDGFRVDAIAHLYEDYELQDETVLPDKTADGNYGSWNHSQTANLPEIMDMINRWRGLLNEYTYNPSGLGYRFMMSEAYAEPDVVNMYYGRTPDGGADFPFNFNLLGLESSCDGECIDEKVQSVYDNLPEGKWANWVLGNHDRPRIASSIGANLVDGMNMLLLLLQGTPTSYYGEELGMSDLDLALRPNPPWDTSPDARDKVRSPMQWSPGENAGFSSYPDLSDVWIPVNSDSSTVNVETQKGNSTSHLEVYKALSALRKEDAFRYGNFKRHLVSEDIYSFTRFYDGLPTYLVVIHFGADGPAKQYDLSAGIPDGVETTVAATTGSTVYEVDQEVSASSLTLQRGQGVVLSWPFQIDQLI